MANFQVPVSLYMSSPVVSVSPETPFEEAFRVASERGISSLAVTEGDILTGLITRTDLLRIGHREAGGSGRAPALSFPEGSVADEMTRDVAAVSPGTSVAEAAHVMRKRFIHRVFVTDEGKLVGVLSTRDLMRALEEKKSNHSVTEYMSSPVFTIRDEESLGTAIERLERAHVSGLVVVEEGWPVGIFAQAEALDARDLPASTAVGDVMNPRVLVLPTTMKLHRAAAQAAALGVRRIVIQGDDGEPVGILSGLDFAEAVA